MKKTIIFLLVLVVTSCNDVKKESDKVLSYHDSEMQNTLLSDSLFIGIPLVKDPFFIKNIVDGFEHSSFIRFDSILNSHNTIFSKFKNDEIIKSIKVTPNLSFELKRKKYKKIENQKDIQIILYTKFKGTLRDSILFYKYHIDKVGQYTLQRHETLSYIDEKLNLYSLNTYTGLSEDAVEVDSWNKYSIEENSGKIKLINKMNYREIAQKEQEKMDKSIVINENTENTSSSKIFDYEFEDISFHYDCNVSDFVNFSLNDGDFSCPSNGIRFEASLIKTDESNFELKYSEIRGYEIESSLDSKNYSKEISIGKIKYSDNKIEFTWLGFYNTKTKKREFLENPFTGKIENSSIILKNCKG